MQSKNLQEVKANIEAKDPNLKKGRSLSDVPNPTAKTEIGNIRPVGDNVLISLKTWPAQNDAGLLVPDSYTVIRGEMYIAEVLRVGETVSHVRKGDVVIISMFSGHHVTTITGHAKVIKETDVIMYKSVEKDALMSYEPTTFTPGINYMMVEMSRKAMSVTKSGIIAEMGDDAAFSKNDSVTASGTVLGIGPLNKYGTLYGSIKNGDVVIFDSYAGLNVNTSDITDIDKYKIVLVDQPIAVVDL